MISLENVTVSLPRGKPQAKTILKDITLSIETGERVLILGGNGSGKTTLLQAVAGLIPLDSGTVTFSRCEESCSEYPATPSIALLLQEPDNQFVASSVRNELLLSAKSGMKLHGPNRGDAIRNAIEMFELEGILDRNPHRLSGGEKQRLAFATVWLAAPDILLLDEPTSYLDRRSRKRCYEFVESLNAGGVTILWAAPGGEDLVQSDMTVWIDKGKLRYVGSSNHLFSQEHDCLSTLIPPPLVALSSSLSRELGSRDRFRERVSNQRGTLMKWNGRLRIQTIAKELIDLVDSAHEIKADGSMKYEKIRPGPHLSRASKPDQEVLAFENASFAYDTCEAIHGATFQIPSGQCMGVCGPNGSGKSTILSLASGVLEPTSGRVRRLGMGELDAGEKRIFHLFQSPERMFFAETVFEELAFGLKYLFGEKDRMDDIVSHALSQSGLTPQSVLDRSPFSLSFGEMRRLAFAVCVSLRPKLLLLDEPTACLDVPGKEVLRGILDRFLSKGGTALVASHDVDFLCEICGRLVYLDQGRVVADVDISSGTLPVEANWPDEAKPLIVAVQDAMAAMGVAVAPRAVTVNRLVDLLDYSSQTRNPT
ncbi:MAG: ATP-binding cassette domain-containing protein [Candidatus Latescibacteria bacterium]|nr:ATP-binding cassette domain-containing protein [Candidatus Latescibacterota bacterium]NIM21703.1 ATP-binding cassette domain-containing protein [Candidatus Latescibacterota bacterium]NIM65730.1 ATP-binding cassette domain-containing protein [Candidatus Latescibacterota bacterium]NIO02116.1 ATP-binding cassette domain-containing protein [Candidatus Latescibacterota bacterium]NIO28933.1 ATP-binding cassette domain-containing protein [Candidatus Latescibacterota bacterium]